MYRPSRVIHSRRHISSDLRISIFTVGKEKIKCLQRPKQNDDYFYYLVDLPTLVRPRLLDVLPKWSGQMLRPTYFSFLLCHVGLTVQESRYDLWIIKKVLTHSYRNFCCVYINYNNIYWNIQVKFYLVEKKNPTLKDIREREQRRDLQSVNKENDCQMS